jgi:hypothetical protein
MLFVVGVRCSFRGKNAGSADSRAIGATEDTASGRAARPDGTTVFRRTLLDYSRVGMLRLKRKTFPGS